MISTLIALSLSAAAPVDRRPPVDECAADPSFAEFRENVLLALQRKDAQYILSIVSDDVQGSLGGHIGPAGFASLWELDRPQESLLWDTLSETLRLGCMRADDGSLVAPSFFLQTREGDDGFETFLAVAPEAVLRERPDTTAPVLTQLEWDVLTWLSNPAPGWIEAGLADGRSGFVQAEHVRSLIDYRAKFERIDGRWRMTLFLAGD